MYQGKPEVLVILQTPLSRLRHSYATLMLRMILPTACCMMTQTVVSVVALAMSFSGPLHAMLHQGFCSALLCSSHPLLCT